MAYASTLCFSSLHAENIANAIGRLQFWGIPRVDLANVMRLIIAQRLVRRLLFALQNTEESEVNLKEAAFYAEQTDANLSSAKILAPVSAAVNFANTPDLSDGGDC